MMPGGTPRGSRTGTLGDALPAIALLGMAALLAWAERRWSLRRRREPSAARWARNVTLGGLGAALAGAVEGPVTDRLARTAARHHWGLLGNMTRGSAARTIATLALMDYTLFVWHILLHRWPVLWRFHAVHHADRDLDASTALRFHAGELLLSLPWRVLQISIIGVTQRDLRLWRAATLGEVIFHHSNLRLPSKLERWLSRVIVTPRLHGIHHANEHALQDTNYSSGLALWDHIHGTRRTGIPQQSLTIGLRDAPRADQVTVMKMLALPFKRMLR